MRHGQVQQFDCGSVDRIAKHLIASFEEQRCPNRSQDQHSRRPRQHHHRKNEEHEADAETPEQPSAEQQLKKQGQQSGVKKEIAKKDRQRIFALGKLLGKSLELPAGQRGRERGNTNDRGDGAKIGGRKDGARAVTQVSLPGSRHSNRSIPFGIQFQLASFRKNRHQPRTNQEKRCHTEQQALSTKSLGHEF